MDLKMTNILCQTLLISFFLAALVQSQSIIINKYNQNDSITKCTDGLLSGIDTVVFQSFVDLQHAQFVKSVYFQQKNSMYSDFKTFRTFNVTKDCLSNTLDCKLTGMSTFVITLRLSALLNLSKAKLRGVIVTADSRQIFSDVIEFPQIYDIKNTTESLILNGRHVDILKTNCMEHIHNGEFKLEFRCTSPASPCLIRMALNTSDKIENDLNLLRLNRNFEESTVFKVNIDYGACRLDKYVKLFKCEIKIDTRPIESLVKNLDHKTKAIIALSIIIAITLICCAFCIRRKIWRILKIFVKKFFRRRYDTINNNEEINLSNDDSNVYVFKDKQQNEESLRDDLKKLNTNNNETIVCKALFDFERMKEPFFDDRVMKIISLIGKLTVMITVDTYTGFKRQGTGFIGFATKYGKNEDKNKCYCNKCTSSTPEGKIEGEIVVYTSTNIVATNKEAKNTTCTIFFDDPKSETVTIHGMVLNEIKDQKCKLTCLTCDTKTLDGIIELRTLLNKENPDFNHTYKRLQKSDSENWTIIISHPFGMHKHISIGKWIKRKERKFKKSYTLTKYKYKAPTFQGSAGAYVYLLGCDHGGWIYVHHHIGVDVDGYGYCGDGMHPN